MKNRFLNVTNAFLAITLCFLMIMAMLPAISYAETNSENQDNNVVVNSTWHAVDNNGNELKDIMPLKSDLALAQEPEKTSYGFIKVNSSPNSSSVFDFHYQRLYLTDKFDRVVFRGLNLYDIKYGNESIQRDDSQSFNDCGITGIEYKKDAAFDFYISGDSGLDAELSHADLANSTTLTSPKTVTELYNNIKTLTVAVPKFRGSFFKGFTKSPQMTGNEIRNKLSELYIYKYTNDNVGEYLNNKVNFNQEQLNDLSTLSPGKYEAVFPVKIFENNDIALKALNRSMSYRTLYTLTDSIHFTFVITGEKYNATVKWENDDTKNRPNSLELSLKDKQGTVVDTLMVNNSNNWATSSKEILKGDYTLEVPKLEGYNNPAITKDGDNKFVVTYSKHVSGGSSSNGSTGSHSNTSSSNSQTNTTNPIVQDLPNVTGKWHKNNDRTWAFITNDNRTLKDVTVKINGNIYSFNKNGIMKTGWHKDSNMWYYFNTKGNGTEGVMAVNTWKKVNGNWYYFYKDGKMAANTRIGKYYVNKSGAWRWNHWIKNSNGRWWYYYKEGNYPKNTIVSINGKRYAFDNSGWMKTGWLYKEGNWYYFNKKGQGTEGVMVANSWKKLDNKWFYFYKDGKMAVDTMIGNYYVNKSGIYSYSHWVKASNGKWWYINQDGSYPRNGLKTIDGSKYYFDTDGWLVTGWLYTNDIWHYFYSNGKMAQNTVIDGYRINSLGNLA